MGGEPNSAVTAIASRNPGVSRLADERFFYAWLRANDMLGPTLSPGEVAGVSAIVDAASAARWPIGWAAYALATAYLETGHRMQPVTEAGGEDYFRRRYDLRGLRPDKARELGNTQPGDGARYCGRGFVQITGRKNYATAAAKLGLALVSDPELALHDDIAAAIMVRGMSEGWFTGRALDDFLPERGAAIRQHFIDARRIINGQDRAEEIADYAVQFQTALAAGNWSEA